MKEKLNQVHIVLDNAKEELSDLECLKLYEKIAEQLHSDIIEMQDRVRKRMENII